MIIKKLSGYIVKKKVKTSATISIAFIVLIAGYSNCSKKVSHPKLTGMPSSENIISNPVNVNPQSSTVGDITKDTPTVKSITIDSDQIRIEGTYIQNITELKIDEKNILIVSSNETSLVGTISNSIKWIAGAAYNLIISTAAAETTDIQINVNVVQSSVVTSGHITSAEQKVENDTITKDIVVTTPSTLILHGWGSRSVDRTNLSPAVVNAGAKGSLLINGVECARATDFEGESSTVTFDVSTSCSRVLAPGNYELKFLLGKYGANYTTFQHSEISWTLLRN